ncbi:MAG: hypothetical protein A4E58_00075 [Syntrophorhabdus sp. PtaB.Bin006]|nr:MAG: hypothetical protein A4E58_00075 [Syntrophorhabdus sp. PtaB.Bin006]
MISHGKQLRYTKYQTSTLLRDIGTVVAYIKSKVEIQ